MADIIIDVSVQSCSAPPEMHGSIETNVGMRSPLVSTQERSQQSSMTQITLPPIQPAELISLEPTFATNIGGNTNVSKLHMGSQENQTAIRRGIVAMFLTLVSSIWQIL
ncbi:hypothetical protein O6H91_12G007900 [Diphasiastrum complanatum]|uniref:Uncharacterized protein n=1 Tax=Diphasiastrum complanatum TaxID=34168 RepID=A0ACC2BYN4_DIPCM|nr:hypothetical protein O6H91_12G007900 [Diphasiastrum complanatum]